MNARLELCMKSLTLQVSLFFAIKKSKKQNKLVNNHINNDKNPTKTANVYVMDGFDVN